MEYKTTSLPGVLLMIPRVFQDSRGYLFEGFSQKEFDTATGKHIVFDQEIEYEENEGFEFTKDDHQKDILLRCISGEIEVIVSSETFEQKFTLNSENKHQLFIPNQYNLRFIVQKDETFIQTKTTI